MIEREKKAEIIKNFAIHPDDRGSPEVQIALLTTRIKELEKHFARHPKDYNSRRGFMILIGRRKRLLKYLHRIDEKRYKELIKKLRLRK
ncbi:MAG: 30S ribosomal protein S15 [bacterium]